DYPQIPSITYSVRDVDPRVTDGDVASGRRAHWSRGTLFDFAFAGDRETVPTKQTRVEDLELREGVAYESLLVAANTQSTAGEVDTVVARLFNLGGGAFAL